MRVQLLLMTREPLNYPPLDRLTSTKSTPSAVTTGYWPTILLLYAIIQLLSHPQTPAATSTTSISQSSTADLLQRAHMIIYYYCIYDIYLLL